MELRLSVFLKFFSYIPITEVAKPAWVWIWVQPDHPVSLAAWAHRALPCLAAPIELGAQQSPANDCVAAKPLVLSHGTERRLGPDRFL